MLSILPQCIFILLMLVIEFMTKLSSVAYHTEKIVESNEPDCQAWVTVCVCVCEYFTWVLQLQVTAFTFLSVLVIFSWPDILFVSFLFCEVHGLLQYCLVFILNRSAYIIMITNTDHRIKHIFEKQHKKDHYWVIFVECVCVCVREFRGDAIKPVTVF